MSPLVAIFLTVFIDLFGFGMFIPDLQLRGKELAETAIGPHGSAAQIGFLTGAVLAIYSLAQLITAPILGRLSDRKGRRSVLLISSALTVVSYLFYAFAEHYWAVGISRALSGIAAANLGVAFAYVSDITTTEDRAKGLGLMGAAFGLGFILGPPTGAMILVAGHNHPMWLGLAGASLAIVNLAFIIFIVPESLKSPKVEKGHLLSDFSTALKAPGLRVLLLMFFAIGIGWTNLESTYFQLIEDKRWIFHTGEDARRVGAIILACVGIVMAFMQGFAVGKITPKLGEVRMARYGLLFMAPALALVPFMPLWIPTLITVVALGITNGLAGPSINSLISRTAPRTIQGGIFGVTQSLGALARVIGPLMSNPLFAFRPYAPYVLGGTILLIPALLAWTLRIPAPENLTDATVIGH